MIVYDLFWPYMAILWAYIDLIGLVSSFLAVIDPNSFGLVSFGSCVVFTLMKSIDVKRLKTPPFGFWVPERLTQTEA